MHERAYVSPPAELQKATAAQTEGRYTLLTGVFRPGGFVPSHVHADCDEGFYVLEGELTVRIDGESVTAEAGSFVFVPRGAIHSPGNASTAETRALMLFAPGGIEGFFREQDDYDWGSMSPEEAIETLNRIGSKYGMEFRDV